MKKQKEKNARSGQTPWRKNREPEKMRRKPFTGERTNREIRNVRVTDVTAA